MSTVIVNNISVFRRANKTVENKMKNKQIKTILLIEDDAVLRENTAELLEISNYKVLTASNGKSGILIAKKYMPDIIICDIIMPELNGYDVLKHLSKNNKTMYIPFVFLSAKTEHKDVRKGMDMGADDYITKPFDEDELLNAIESRLVKAAILKDYKNSPELAEGELKTLEDLKNFFDDNGETYCFNMGDEIYTEGQNSNTIYLIRKGAVKCHKLDELGKELITTLYKEDELFGYTSFTQNIPYQETATALKDTELIGVSKQDLYPILENNHKLTLELVELLNKNLIDIKEHLLQMAYGSVIRKSAAAILKFAEKLNKKPEDPINISRSDLANVAGIATETFIRTMTDFKKKGIIEMEGRNIKIVNVNKLKHMI